MTKEEARLTLQQNFGLLSFEYPGRITEALKIALEALSDPPLPSNLEEAADYYASKSWVYGGVFHEAAKNTFKAGAEWMASQGETAEVGYWNQRGLSLRLDQSLEKLGYKDGDKVIVQIRKK